jgi:hypothetical protein
LSTPRRLPALRLRRKDQEERRGPIPEAGAQPTCSSWSGAGLKCASL